MKISVHGLCFRYGSTDVVSEVDLEAGEGEIIGILGPNGSGKTTLLKCLNRSLSPRTGTVLIDDRDYRTMTRREIATRMGTVPQSANINFPFTALDIVMMGRLPELKRFESETENDLQIVRDAMAVTNTQQFADRPMDQLSGGERQRVIIARALAQRPRVLLLDEPTLHLDVNHQLDILDMITSLARADKLIVMIVTHDLALAARYCDQVVLMQKGKVLAAGEVTEVLTPVNLRRVFGIEATVYYDERIGSHSVAIIRSVRDDL
ncbi:MAG: ABC transporter ATP-binding protein [Methanomassiliicoccus sp.]|nr:ABC transporter ATP-binding protein [Methanomassiliicoccus sp.]